MDTTQNNVTLAAIQANNPNEGLLDGRIVKIHILHEDHAVAEFRRRAIKHQLGKEWNKSLAYWEHAHHAARCEDRLRRALGLSSTDRLVVPLVSLLLSRDVIKADKAQHHKAGRCRCWLSHR